MLKRFAPLVPIALTALLAACASQAPQPQVDLAAEQPQPPVEYMTDEQAAADITDDQPYELPSLADSILSQGLSLVGTKYRFGGTSIKTGFDCSGFIGYLFKE